MAAVRGTRGQVRTPLPNPQTECPRNMSNAVAHKPHAQNKHPAKPKQHPAHVVRFVSAHVGDARNISARTGIPAEVILAQSALESSWGQSVRDNAYFGIKGKSSSGSSTRFTTHEVLPSGQRISQVDEFRAYASYTEAADDYGSLIQRRYGAALAYRNDPAKFVQAVANQGYATDPHYAEKLKSIIRLHITPLLGQFPEATPAAQPAP